MATRKTWLWIIGGAGAAGVLTLIGAAGAGVYFVSRHVHSEMSTSADAIDAFERVTTAFAGRRPLYELDQQDRPNLTTELSSLPTAPAPPRALMVQAWNPDAQRLVRASLPLWLVRLGPDRVRVSRHAHSFDFSQLHLDVNELERIGPALVLDYRNQDGVRILLWTQ